MALKAGYYGVKKSLLDIITGLAGSKIIKSIGNGLNLTDAGALSTDIDTDTMEYKNGKLAAKSVSWDYSTDEVDTGQKWVDGRPIYCKVWDFGESTIEITGPNIWTTFDNDVRGVAGIINGGWMNTDLSTFNNASFFADATNNRLQMLSTRSGYVYVNKIILFYVKASVEPDEASATRSTKKTTKKTASADNE